jgi:glycosyltransferase involved in cell wall biosynthesis
VVVPSIWREAFGRVVVEGLATGSPVVASRGGGIPEIMEGDLAWLMFEMGSEVELAERLASLMSWRRDRPGLSQQCMARAERFSIERMVDGVERILHDAVASRASPA